MAANDMQWSSATPGYLIILIDQSGSMMSPYEGETRTSFASKVINRVINEIIQKNFNGEKPKNRCFITVIGYNHNVKEICSGYLEDLYSNPVRIDSVKKKMPDGAGGIIEIDTKMPVWVEAIDKDGTTNMKGAFEMAKELVSKWMEDKPQNPAPVIINISDGIPYYNGQDISICMRETIDVANEIMNLSCEDGNVLIFNAEVGSENGTKVVFPNDKSAISSTGAGAEFLYEITSVVPEGYKEAATKNELPMSDNARGCIFHAEGVDLINLINFGSSKGQKDKK
ncbi:VWA domain-containing protein [Prevotella melaninogenica]|uniref:vWA domain-containing protein n=1 Tax=Prevotella melaninogenica TaxID=28132 RepID=UPI001BA634BD|nr:vWA domain-containing protein [Prevotella melaninogenica]QUB60859.1 VWA domain-containing protein [Prevotella melaninogenica]